MEVGRLDIDLDEHEPMRLFFLGDIHEGQINCDHRALERAVALIEDTKRKIRNTYVFLMGDMIDCILPNTGDKRWNPLEVCREYSIHDLKSLPFKQVERVTKALDPIKDCVVVCLVGNHEESYMVRHSAPVYAEICKAFPNVEKNGGKLGYVGMFRIASRRNVGGGRAIDIALSHGCGGGGYLPGYKTNATHNVFRWFDCDLNVQGHIHKLDADRVEKIGIKQNVSDFYNKPVWMGSSGTFLSKYKLGTANYFEHKPGTSSDIGFLQADISFSRRQEGERRDMFRDIELRKIYMR